MRSGPDIPSPSETFRRVRADGHIALTVAPKRLYFTIAGALHSEEIIAVLDDAGKAGLLTSDHFSALVDMRHFTGVIDWKVIP